MARTKEIRISKAVTHNLGNYESVRIEVGLTKDINEGDDLEAEIAESSGLCQEWLKAEFSDFLAKKNKKEDRSENG